jgi:hypothetical protein
MNFDYMTPEEESMMDEMMAMAHDATDPMNLFEDDMVNHPPHYQTESGLECIDAIRAMLGEEAFKDYCRGTAMKYIWRTGNKWDAEEDIKKAIWYLQEMNDGH